MHLVVLTPVLNDWVSAREILRQLDAAFASRAEKVSVLFVDDGSTEPPPPGFGRDPYVTLQSIDILKLQKNLGHQRAIAVGLCHIAEKIPCDAVVVMDSDGEDAPSDVPRLADRLAELNRHENPAHPLVFAERTRRSESSSFQLGYFVYRQLHVLLTGRRIRFGNFSIVPYARLGALTTDPMLWNHYAASVVGSRLPFTTMPTHRGKRIAGTSHHNYLSLVVHGLSALSCYNDIIGVRLLAISSVLFVVSVGGLLVTVGLRLGTSLPIPGWTSVFAGLIAIFLLQVITLASNFTLQIISARGAQPFLPRRDYVWYVEDIKSIFSRPL